MSLLKILKICRFDFAGDTMLHYFRYSKIVGFHTKLRLKVAQYLKLSDTVPVRAEVDRECLPHLRLDIVQDLHSNVKVGDTNTKRQL